MTARLAPAVVLLAALVAVFAYKIAAKMPDFEVYWRAGGRAAAAEPLYREEDEHFRLKYLPAFAVLAIPAAMLPLPGAKAIWFGISVALIPVLLALSIGLLPTRHRPAWTLALITFVLMAKFYGHELVLGQVNVLFAVMVLAGVQLVASGRPVAAGLLFALAMIIKPYAVLFLPWLAAGRAMRALAVAAAGLLTALVLPIPLYGWPGTVALHRDWWRTVTESTAPNLLNADNVSLAAMYAKWIGTGGLSAALAVATGAALLAVAAFAFVRGRGLLRPEGLEAALLLTLIPLLSPQGWDYVFLIATPAVVFFLNYDRELPSALRVAAWLALAIAAFTLYDVVGKRVYGYFMAWSVVSVCYLLVIGSLAALRSRRVA
ncbi:MAG TPA: glycosyltransferase family 87 protein [Vicinamibacterales bacterium]|nr:glycosyltransferase family 87 protein [Vicinamibacterales bacterium]